MRTLLTLLAGSLITANAAASQPATEYCEQPSQGLVSLGDTYYNIADRYQVTDENRETLQAFYQQLEGRWSGEIIDQPCTRRNADTPKLPRYYELKQATGEINHKGMLIIRGEKHPFEPVDGQHRYEPIRLDSRIDFWPGKDLSVVEFIDKNTVTSISHYNQRNLGNTLGLRPATSVRERQDTLMLQGDTLLVQTRWYINGYFTGTESMKLTRR